MKLPVARYLSDGEWLIATEREFSMRKLCVNVDIESHVTVTPPYTMILLESGCRALSDVIELPMYFQERREYKVMRENRITTPLNVQLTNMSIWSQVNGRLNIRSRLRKLGDIEDTDISVLANMLDNLEVDEAIPLTQVILPYVIMGVIVITILGLLYTCRKRLLGLIAQKVIKRLHASAPVYMDLTRDTTCPLLPCTDNIPAMPHTSRDSRTEEQSLPLTSISSSPQSRTKTTLPMTKLTKL